MARGWYVRALGAGGAAALGIALAFGAGAPLAATLLALLAGAIATALVWPASAGHLKPGQAVDPARRPTLPAARDLLEAVEDPLLIVRDRRVVFANPAARAVLGNHIAGVDVRLAIRHPAAAERLLERDGADGGERVTRTELAGLGEHQRRWEMTVTRLADGHRLVRLIDRSESHASEQMRTDFVANASHELRTPLATLLGFLETLSDEAVAADPPTRTRFLRIMWDEARRMHRLVDDLISLSRIEAERFSLPRESVALLPVVEDVRAALAAMLEESGSDIRVEADVADPVVLGDRIQLVQLLQNLVTNGVKYGRPGTPVRLRFDTAGPDMLRLSVTDEGEGIAAEHLPRLTERFYRVDPSRSRSMGGTGLGLAIVKHIVGRHRGRLDIRSQLGEGTTVEVLLPKPPVAATEEETAG